jgi:hypothetical protein
VVFPRYFTPRAGGDPKEAKGGGEKAAAALELLASRFDPPEDG